MCGKCYDKKFVKLNKLDAAAKAEGEEGEGDGDDDEDEDEDCNEDEDYDETDEEDDDDDDEDEDGGSKKKKAAGGDEDGDKKAGGDKKKKPPVRLETLLPPQPDPTRCKLFGKGSVITLNLDTDVAGGALTFEVDGVALHDEAGESVLPNIFAMMGSSQVRFSCTVRLSQLFACLNCLPVSTVCLSQLFAYLN